MNGSLFLRKNAQHVKKYFLADSKKENDAYFAWRFACCCFQKAARFLSAKMRVVILLVSRRYSQHILGLWKKKYRESKKKKKE